MVAIDDSTGTYAAADRALGGIGVVSIALNLPGPHAAARLRDFGASVHKVEPPVGDPMQSYSPGYYEELHRGIAVKRIDLKETQGRMAFDELVSRADILITSQRPNALERLGLAWKTLHARWPALGVVSIIGHDGPCANEPGHDLTYSAAAGLVRPPNLPPTLSTDLHGAERAVSAAFALLQMRAATGTGHYAHVALEAAARALARPLVFGLTAENGVVGGGSAGYNVYQTRDGWIALAALEPHFLHRALGALGLAKVGQAEFASAFLQGSCAHWKDWARQHDIPLEVVR